MGQLIVVVIVIYILLCFVGCLDRGCAAGNADARVSARLLARR